MVSLVKVQMAPLAERFQVFVPVIARRVVQMRDRQNHADTPRLPPLLSEELEVAGSAD